MGLNSLPAVVVIVPVVLSLVAWLLPTHPAGLTGFVERAQGSSQGAILFAAWTASAVLVATIAFASARGRGPLPGLRDVSLDRFHLAALVVGAVGTGWIYWSVTGGSVQAFVALWTQQDFTRFRTDFDYGVGIATGRYASVLAGGITLARVAQGQRLRRIDLASLLLLAAVVLLNSRVSALMAIGAAAGVIAFSDRRHSLRLLRITIASLSVAALFVVANYVRNADQYRAAGVRDPISMAALNAQSYLATPANVTIGVSAAAMDERALPPSSLEGALDPALPPYLAKLVRPVEPVLPHANVEDRYQGTVDLSLSLTTNGTFIDVLMQSGWVALLTALLVIFIVMWLAGRFVSSGPIGAAVGGVLLYALSETWRVFLFSTGNIHFIVLFGLAAASIGYLRHPGPLPSGADARFGSFGLELGRDHFPGRGPSTPAGPSTWRK